jgi:hypothetical protein
MLNGDYTQPLSRDHLKSKEEKSVELIGNQFWRLNNLYYCVDEDANKLPFKMNRMQLRLWKELHYWNIVLKARQFGATTFICLLGLDMALFNDNVTVHIIAHTIPDAEKIFKNKIAYPYSELPDDIKEVRSATTENVRELRFANNSSISVSNSPRGGTVNFLHISEFGKICAKFPDKALEIKTGGFPAVHPGNMCFVESTAEGASGQFYDMCMQSIEDAKLGRPLSKKTFKFHFFPWYENPKNIIDPSTVEVPLRISEYLDRCEQDVGIKFTSEQRAWYAVEERNLGDDMRRENPVSPEEAFQQAIEGAYYSSQIYKILEEGRLCSVPHMSGYPVNTAWDIGVYDETGIWFYQIVGRELHVLDYYEEDGAGIQHFIEILRQKSDEHGYVYGTHYAPHDIRNREWGSDAQSRINIAARLGIFFEVAPPPTEVSVQDGIESVRETLQSCWFDKERCQHGFAMLSKYRKEWDARRGVWKSRPYHDETSHAADAFRCLALTWKKPMHKGKIVVEPKIVSAEGWT